MMWRQDEVYWIARISKLQTIKLFLENVKFLDKALTLQKFYFYSSLMAEKLKIGKANTFCGKR
jgi:hypothetical protein